MMCVHKHSPQPHECAPPQDSLRRIGRQRQHSSGMALLLMMGTLVLLSVMILAFLSTVNTERIASGSQLNQTEARLLADNVLSLVTAQIREATTQPNTVWASQPGLIWNWDASGNTNAFKLYSSSNMVATSFNPAQGADLSASWSTLTDQFVDLNSPARRRVGGSTVTNYPILDPGLAWNGTAGIKGFSNNSTGANMVASGSSANPLPMPVRWLYVLQNGTLQAMDSSGKVSLASSNNPIVGRVAFWADDESCKININTASQGTFWDVPRGRGNNFEKGAFSTGFTISQTGLGVGQPVQGEYQRYPGHPATTSLGVVLNATNPATGNFLFWPGVTDTTQRGELIYQLIPRVNGGGSKGGTFCPPPTDTNTSRLRPDGDRLYASVDELAFSGAFTGTSRTNNISTTTTNSGISVDTIQKMNFFLTASSRAPEVTLFNTPRMTIWPVDVTTNKRSLLDRTIAFCSTLKNTNNTTTEFLFTRNSLDPSELTAVNNGTNTTISSGALSPTKDFGTNNQQLYSYLQRLTSKSIPGFGTATFATKLGADRDQVLTEIFDYIRCINLFDNTTASSSPFTARPWLQGATRYWSTIQYNNYISNPTKPSATVGDNGYYTESLYFGEVVPLQINSNSTRGFGRFAPVVGAALVFFGTEPYVATKKYIDGNPTNTGTNNLVTRKGAGKTSYGDLDGIVTSYPAREIQAMLILTYATPSAGTVDYHHRCDYTITGLQNFKINDQSAGFPSSATTKLFCSGNRGDVRSLSGGAPEWWSLSFPGGDANSYNSTAKGDTNPVLDSYYPFVSARIAINTNSTNNPALTNAGAVDVNTFSFTGGEIIIKASVGTNVVQTTGISFSDFTARNPQWTDAGHTSGSSPYKFYDRPEERTRGAWGGNNNFIFPALILRKSQADVVRMMELKGGDIRMVAGRNSVSKDFFVPHKDYTNSTIYHANSLWRNPMASFGSLVVSSTTTNDIYNGIASNLNGVTGAGDWDISTPVTSVYSTVGGPCGGFINKPDDSGSGYLDQYGAPSSPYFNQNSCIVSSDLYFSPNRMIPSAVMFGSLPTGVARHDPTSSQGSSSDRSWQTLLFRPGGQTGGHPGTNSPPDHLLLDLFTMPVVEPYPISEPFSTAGKINMNYQIAPFTYITRDTGMRAALDAIRITAVPTSNAYLRNLGPAGSDSNNAAMNYRYPIDVDATLTLIADRFGTNNPFKSATEICDIFLVSKPENVTSSGVVPTTKTPYQTSLTTGANASAVNTYMTNFWQSITGGAGTADNLRERPYAALYPRLTTKSNTFTIHVRTQSLKKLPGSDPQTFDKTSGKVTSEYRGSVMVERFLDPNASSFDITATSGSNSILGPYFFRSFNSKQFNP